VNEPKYIKRQTRWYRHWKLFILTGLILSLLISPIIAHGDPSPGLASVDVTITVTPGFHGGPLDFTLTYLSDTDIQADWTPDADSINTLIRVGFGDYPDNPTSGYEVYYGDGVTAHDLSNNLDANGEAYYSAFQEYDTGFSTEYATGYIKGEGMTAIATNMEMIFVFMVIAALNALAFWQRHIFIYLIVVPADIVYGLYLAAGATLYDSEWIEGVVIAVIGLFCLFRAVMKLFSSAED
jgi:hypothetical protein